MAHDGAHGYSAILLGWAHRATPMPGHDVNGWAVAGIAAGMLSLIDPLPYLRDVINGRTRPHRGTWCIWSVLGVAAFLSQWADGASWSLLMVGVQAASITLVFLLSIWRGVGGVGPSDVLLVGVAAAGITGWIVSSQPLVATVCVVLADLAGAALMLPKTWRDPHSETLSTFLLAAAAGCLGTVAVGAVDLGLLLYPGYFTLVNAAIAAVIMRRRRTAVTLPPAGTPSNQRRCRLRDTCHRCPDDHVDMESASSRRS